MHGKKMRAQDIDSGSTVPAQDTDRVRALLRQVTDPEIPVLTISDLGVLRDVYWQGDRLIVEITPTYSGCPAMQTIEQDIRRRLEQAGYKNVCIKTRLAPAWTTDWLSPEGRKQLRDYGIAPPVASSKDKRVLMAADVTISCPRCRSSATELISESGSTACKALYRCRDCLEPFDYFKCI